MQAKYVASHPYPPLKLHRLTSTPSGGSGTGRMNINSGLNMERYRKKKKEELPPSVRGVTSIHVCTGKYEVLYRC